MPGHTVVCGLERLGLRVATGLVQLGERVTVVAEAPDPDLAAQVRRTGARLVEGRAERLPQIREADIGRARCLVLTGDADLANLHAALAAREANPDLQVVIRMFSADLAEQANRLLANAQLISSSYEAAPHFVAASLGVAVRPTRLIWGRFLTVDGDEDGPDDGGHRLRRLAARARPQRAADVDLGDGQLLVPVEEAELPRRRPHLRLRAFRRAVVAFFDRRLAVTAGAIGFLIVVSAAMFHAFVPLSWIDSLYFTVTTASTTGYGDINIATSSWWLKLYDVGFMLLAAIGLALLYALVADAVVGFRIMEALGVPRGRMRDHVVVIGLGSVGYRVTQRLLDLGYEVAGAEVRETSRWVPLVRRQGVPVLIADGRYTDSLRLLSVERARAVIAATDDDLANVEAALAARQLNPGARIVARLFDPEMAARAQRQLGIDACHSVSALAAPTFVAAALGNGVRTTVAHGHRLWLVGERRVADGSLDVSALEGRGDLRVLAVRGPDGTAWRPETPGRLLAGDDVLVASSREAWERLGVSTVPS